MVAPLPLVSRVITSVSIVRASPNKVTCKLDNDPNTVFSFNARLRQFIRTRGLILGIGNASGLPLYHGTVVAAVQSIRQGWK